MERMLVGDAAIGPVDVASLAQAQYDGLTNIPIVAALLSFFVAQSLKVLTTWYNSRLRHSYISRFCTQFSPF